MMRQLVFLFLVIPSQGGRKSTVPTEGYDEYGAGVYQKLDNIIYPYQQWLVVRREESVQHLPPSPPAPLHPLPAKPEVLQQSKQSASESEPVWAEEDEGEVEEGTEEESQRPRLTEELNEHKKQEVYEEKGYSDGAYDHAGYSYGREEGKGNIEPHPQQSQQQQQQPETQSSTTQEQQQHPSLHQSPSTILQKIATSATKMHQMSPYSKESQGCPEIEPNPQSKSKPRLKGLGDKIKCLKEKYFGKQPLSPEIFMEPTHSVESIIRIPSWSEFYEGFLKEGLQLGF